MVFEKKNQNISTNFFANAKKRDMNPQNYNQGAIFFALVFLGLSLTFGIIRLGTPKPVYADAKIQDFSAMRALYHLEKFAQKPHPIGSLQNDSVRMYLLEEARKAGAEVYEQDTVIKTAENRYARVRNLIFYKRGTMGEKAKAVLVAGHHDSVIFGPGAADDGAACAAVLECLRAMKASGELLRNDVIFLLTDGEELGLLGAQAWLNYDKDAKRIGIVLNFEARGTAGQPLLFQTCGEQLPLINALQEVAPAARAGSLFEEVYKKLPNGTDFFHFSKDIPFGMNFAFIEKHTHYHTQLDTPENIDKGTMQVQGEIMLNLLRYFGKTDLESLPAGKVIYFDYPLRGIVSYSEMLALPASVIVALFSILLLITTIFKKQFTIRRFFAALGLLLLLFPSTVGAVWYLWKMIYETHQAYHATNTGDIYAADLYFWSFSAFAVGLNLLITSLFAKKIGAANLQTVFALIISGLNVYVSAAYPGASYVSLALAKAAVLIGFYTSLRNDFTGAYAFDSWVTGGIFFFLSLLILPLLYQLQVAMTVHFSGGTIAAVLLFFWACYGFWHLFHQNTTRTFSYMLLLGSLLAWLYASADTKFDAKRPKNNSLFATYDADRSLGKWASFDKKTDDFTVNFLTEEPFADSLKHFHQFFKREFLTKTDSLIRPKIPAVGNAEVQKDSLRKKISFALSSGERAELCILKFPFHAKKVVITHEKGIIHLHDTLKDVVLFAMPDVKISAEIPADSSKFVFSVQEMKYGLESVLRPEHPLRPASMMPRPIFGNHSLWIAKTFVLDANIKEPEKKEVKKAKNEVKKAVKPTANANQKTKKRP